MFVDEKDSSSKLILSHIYLLIGFSYPLWVSNFKGINYLYLLLYKDNNNNMYLNRILYSSNEWPYHSWYW